MAASLPVAVSRPEGLPMGIILTVTGFLAIMWRRSATALATVITPHINHWSKTDCYLRPQHKPIKECYDTCRTCCIETTILFDHGQRTAWCTISCYGKPQTMMSPSSNWLCKFLTCSNLSMTYIYTHTHFTLYHLYSNGHSCGQFWVLCVTKRPQCQWQVTSWLYLSYL